MELMRGCVLETENRDLGSSKAHSNKWLIHPTIARRIGSLGIAPKTHGPQFCWPVDWRREEIVLFEVKV